MKFLMIIFVIGANVKFSRGNPVEPNENLPGFPTCDESRVTWHLHPFSCTKYVLCYHGNIIERLCAPGLHFNPILEQCMLPQLARCDINYACPSVDDELNPVFLPDATDCTKYFVCFKGSPLARTCAEDLWWDTVYNWCTFADEVVCDSRVPNNPNVPTTEAPPTEMPTTEIPTTIPTTVPTTTVPTTTQTTTTQNPNTMNCPISSVPSFHPHTRSCSLYFICINGVAFLRECAPRTLFDIIERACIEEETATCISGTATDPDNLPDNLPDYVPQAFSFVCPLHVSNEIALFPHQSKCERYYLCEKGVAFLRTCPSAQYYDVLLEQCQSKNEAVCLKDL